MNRDTQFQGFAKALVDELTKPEIVAIGMRISSFRGEWERIIARRAYDLACHTIRSQAQGMDLLCLHDSEWMKERVELVPDMTELPKEQDQ